MFENIERDEERGQVGIGTLIVFIALVLVAAIAAGVLINTAGFLQNQAESTGQESTNQVSNNVQVLSATGTLASAGGPVDAVTLTLGVGPGSDAVDLSTTRFQFLGSQAQTVSGSDIGTATTAGSITESDTDDDIISPGERVEVTLTLVSDGTYGTDLQLSSGSEAEIQITTPDGSQTTEVLNVPDPIDGSDAVRL
jgi:flagellin FlaB